MYARVVEISTKPEKSQEVANMIDEKVLPILRQQAGFLDETVFTSDMEPNRVLALSFWKTKEDAERYQREHYARVTEILSNLMECPPAVRKFNVHSSTPHKLVAGKAA